MPKFGKQGISERLRSGIDQVSSIRTSKLKCREDERADTASSPTTVPLENFDYLRYSIRKDADVYVKKTTRATIFDDFEQSFEPVAPDQQEPQRSVSIHINNVQAPLESFDNPVPADAGNKITFNEDYTRLNTEPAQQGQEVLEAFIEQKDEVTASFVEERAEEPEPIAEEDVVEESPIEESFIEEEEEVAETVISAPEKSMKVREVYNAEDDGPEIIIKHSAIEDFDTAEAPIEPEQEEAVSAPAEELSPEMLFGTLIHRQEKEVIVRRGVAMDEGYVKETKAPLATDSRIADLERIESYVDSKIDAAKDAQVEGPKEFVDDPQPIDCQFYEGSTDGPVRDDCVLVERAVPKLEDFSSAIPAVAVKTAEVREVPEEGAAAFRAMAALIASEPVWEVLDYAAEAFRDYKMSEPEEEPVPVAFAIRGWDITEESAETFTDYLSIWPQYPRREKAMPAWDIRDYASEAYLAYGEIEPEFKRADREPFQWDASEEVAESYGAYLTIWPQYPRKEKAMPAWDITVEASESFESYMSIEPEYPSRAGQNAVFDVTEEAAEMFNSYLTIWPKYPRKEKEMPAWDIAEESAETFVDYMSIRPEFIRASDFVPEWDIAEESAETFTDYLSIWPQYPRREKAMPAWDITGETADIFGSYMSIRPEFIRASDFVPEWDIAEYSAETFVSYLGIWPEYPRKEKEMPAWDIRDYASEAFVAYGEIRPQYPRSAPAPWTITAESAEAFVDYQCIVPEYPRAVFEVPEWDATEAASEAFGDHMRMYEELQMQAVYEASLKTVAADTEQETSKPEDSLGAAAFVVQSQYAKTSTIPENRVRVKDNDEINQENRVVIPEKRKGRASRFQFKDGKLQKVVDEIELPAVTPVKAKAEDIEIEMIGSADTKRPFRAPLTVESEVKEVAAEVPQAAAEGVSFSFGASSKGYGSVRFSF